MQTPAIAASSTRAQTGTLAALLFSMAIGAGLVFAVGMAHASALHDAAHDIRHANGFPCH